MQLRVLPSALKRRRLERAWTQAELARHAGVHASSVSRLEQGAEVTRPSVIGKIAGALDCRVADIAEVVEDDVPEKAAV